MDGLSNKILYELSCNEWFEIKKHLLNDEEFCPICHEWRETIFDIPERYKPYISPFMIEKEKACAYCISNAATKKKYEDEKHFLEGQGHLNFNKSLFEQSIFGNQYYKRKDNGPGFVYIFKHDDWFKIGATMSSVINRMYDGKYSRKDFICAIQTDLPFRLEELLHTKFMPKKIKGISKQEVFALSKMDLDYIQSLQTLNGNHLRIITDIGQIA